MSALLGFWPYLAALALGVVLGGYGAHKVDSVPYSRLEATYASFQTQVAEERAAAEKAAREAIAAQIANTQRTEAHNETIMAGLRSELGTTSASLDFAHRLLAAAQAGRALPGDRAVSPASGGPSAPGTAPAPGGGSLVADLGASATEVRQCFATLKALQDEVRPQL